MKILIIVSKHQSVEKFRDKSYPVTFECLPSNGIHPALESGGNGNIEA